MLCEPPPKCAKFAIRNFQARKKSINNVNVTTEKKEIELSMRKVTLSIQFHKSVNR